MAGASAGHLQLAANEPSPGEWRLIPPRLGGQWPNAGPHAQPFAPSPERLHALPSRPLHAPLGPGAVRFRLLCAPAARRITALAWRAGLPRAAGSSTVRLAWNFSNMALRALAAVLRRSVNCWSLFCCS